MHWYCYKKIVDSTSWCLVKGWQSRAFPVIGGLIDSRFEPTYFMDPWDKSLGYFLWTVLFSPLSTFWTFLELLALPLWDTIQSNLDLATMAVIRKYVAKSGMLLFWRFFISKKLVIQDFFVGKLRFVAILTVAKSGFDCILYNNNIENYQADCGWNCLRQ